MAFWRIMQAFTVENQTAYPVWQNEKTGHQIALSSVSYILHIGYRDI